MAIRCQCGYENDPAGLSAKAISRIRTTKPSLETIRISLNDLVLDGLITCEHENHTDDSIYYALSPVEIAAVRSLEIHGSL